MYRVQSIVGFGITNHIAKTLAVVVFLYCALIANVRADEIPVNEVRSAFENIVVDTEFALLCSYEGTFGGPLDYFSEMTDTGWTGTLSGTYAGEPLEIVYTGDTADFSSMSWTGSGTWGAQTWSSSGTAQYTDPMLTGILDIENMQVGLSVSGTVGVGSVEVKLVKDLDDRKLIGSVTASALDIPKLGSALSKELSLTLDQDTWTYKSAEKYTILFGWASRTKVFNRGRIFHKDPEIPQVPPIPPSPPWPDPFEPEDMANPPGNGFNPGFAGPGGITYNQMQVGAVPEPSCTFVICELAAFAASIYCWRWRKRAAG